MGKERSRREPSDNPSGSNLYDLEAFRAAREMAGEETFAPGADDPAATYLIDASVSLRYNARPQPNEDEVAERFALLFQYVGSLGYDQSPVLQWMLLDNPDTDLGSDGGIKDKKRYLYARVYDAFEKLSPELNPKTGSANQRLPERYPGKLWSDDVNIEVISEALMRARRVFSTAARLYANSDPAALLKGIKLALLTKGMGIKPPAIAGDIVGRRRARAEIDDLLKRAWEDWRHETEI